MDHGAVRINDGLYIAIIIKCNNFLVGVLLGNISRLLDEENFSSMVTDSANTIWFID